MKRIACRAFLSLALGLAAAASSAAQDMLRAVAVVNDEVISMLDLDMRTRLVILATGQEDTPDLRNRIIPQVMRRLIDERLQAQEAEQLDISVSEAEVTKAIAELARRNKMSPEEFLNLLKRRGVLPGALRDQVRAQLIWRTLVSRRLRPSVRISQEEIDEVAQRIIASRGATQRRIAEIFLAVDSARQDDEVRRNAERLLEDLRAGAVFPALARQFSQSATAARGGDLGWVQEGQLPEELDRVLASMKPGMISGPVRTLRGYHILLLRRERQIPVGESTLNLKQVLIALPAGATAEEIRTATARAAGVREKVDGCSGVDALVNEVGSSGSGDLGTVKLSDLPAAIQDAVKGLAIGQASEPVAVPGGISVLVVCGRDDSGIDRERIGAQLVIRRLDVLSRRYMRDLLRAANVDIRI